MSKNEDTLVLVADDEPSMLALLSAYIRSKGYRVLEASDGDMAWQLAHEHLPHCVVLDVMMPGMSGWVANDETAARARKLFDSPVTWKGVPSGRPGGALEGARVPENFRLRTGMPVLVGESNGRRRSDFRSSRNPMGAAGLS
jgi:hypothetical protein